MTKITKIDKFDWPSKKRELKGYKTTKKYRWLWGVMLSVLAFMLSLTYFNEVVIESLVQKAEAHYEDPCLELGRYVNGSDPEVIEYCYGT